MYRGLTQFCCASETQSIAFAGNIAWSLTNTMLVIWSSQESTVLQGSSDFFCRHFPFPCGRDEPPVLHCSLLVGVGPNVGCYRHCCRYLNLSTDMFLDISDMFSIQQHNMPNQFNHTSQMIYLENVVWSACRAFQQAQFENTNT